METGRVYTDEYSTMRATWDIYRDPETLAANAPKPKSVLVASFMEYQHAYLFMAGIIAAGGVSTGVRFNETVSAGGNRFKLESHQIYLGKKE